MANEEPLDLLLCYLFTPLGKDVFRNVPMEDVAALLRKAGTFDSMMALAKAMDAAPL